ncbi:hypothetical protein FO519_000371 [Halicephalobus sp. NKZ332]|nr:hypothetical protein FO519_000371 [Halicephalobus sp. NKZ332]
MSEVETIWTILHNASHLLSRPDGLLEFERIYSQLGTQEDQVLLDLASIGGDSIVTKYALEALSCRYNRLVAEGPNPNVWTGMFDVCMESRSKMVCRTGMKSVASILSARYNLVFGSSVSSTLTAEELLNEMTGGYLKHCRHSGLSVLEIEDYSRNCLLPTVFNWLHRIGHMLSNTAAENSSSDDVLSITPADLLDDYLETFSSFLSFNKPPIATAEDTDSFPLPHCMAKSMDTVINVLFQLANFVGSNDTNLAKYLELLEILVSHPVPHGLKSMSVKLSMSKSTLIANNLPQIISLFTERSPLDILNLLYLFITNLPDEFEANTSLTEQAFKLSLFVIQHIGDIEDEAGYAYGLSQICDIWRRFRDELDVESANSCASRLSIAVLEDGEKVQISEDALENFFDTEIIINATRLFDSLTANAFRESNSMLIDRIRSYFLSGMAESNQISLAWNIYVYASLLSSYYERCFRDLLKGFFGGNEPTFSVKMNEIIENSGSDEDHLRKTLHFGFQCIYYVYNNAEQNLPVHHHLVSCLVELLMPIIRISTKIEGQRSSYIIYDVAEPLFNEGFVKVFRLAFNLKGQGALHQQLTRLVNVMTRSGLLANFPEQILSVVRECYLDYHPFPKFMGALVAGAKPTGTNAGLSEEVMKTIEPLVVRLLNSAKPDTLNPSSSLYDLTLLSGIMEACSEVQWDMADLRIAEFMMNGLPSIIQTYINNRSIFSESLNLFKLISSAFVCEISSNRTNMELSSFDPFFEIFNMAHIIGRDRHWREMDAGIITIIDACTNFVDGVLKASEGSEFWELQDRLIKKGKFFVTVISLLCESKIPSDDVAVSAFNFLDKIVEQSTAIFEPDLPLEVYEALKEILHLGLNLTCADICTVTARILEHVSLKLDSLDQFERTNWISYFRTFYIDALKISLQVSKLSDELDSIVTFFFHMNGFDREGYLMFFEELKGCDPTGTCDEFISNFLKQVPANRFDYKKRYKELREQIKVYLC